jgi:hypothetical protein
MPEEALGGDAGVQRLLGEVGGTSHVFVGAVGAGADHADFELLGPAAGCSKGEEGGEGWWR